MKKIIVILLVAVLVITTVVVGLTCSGNRGGQDSTSNSSPSESTGEPQNPYTGKRELLFEIDEGVGGYDFISGYSYDEKMVDTVIKNSYEAVAPLTEKYDVSFLIFPQWYYKENGWGCVENGDLDTLSPYFIKMCEYYKQKGIGLYIEIMASGIYCSSNGELGFLPYVNINHGTNKPRREVPGLGVDLHTVAKLKERFGDTIKGLKIHELIGTQNLALAGDPHAFRIYEEDVKAIVDCCAENDLILNWGDWDWNSAFVQESLSYWLDWGDYAEEKLGKNLIFTWANNSVGLFGEMLSSFEVLTKLKNRFPQADIGFSNQDWFITCSNIMLGIQDTTGSVVEPEYPECDMPIELTTGFTRKAFNMGARLIQYEAPYQLFNCYRSLYLVAELGIANPSLLEGYKGDPSFVEVAMDYTPRIEFKRHIKQLLDEADDFDRVEDFYDTNLDKLTSNSEANPPKIYAQSTVIGINDENAMFYDKYSNNPSVFLRQDEFRFTDEVFGSNVKFATKIAYQRNDHDGVLTVTEGANGYVLNIFNARSGRIIKDEKIFLDNENGKVVDVTTANIIQNNVKNCDVDTDEIIVAREKSGTVKFEVYTVENNGLYVNRCPNVYKTKIVKMDKYLSDVYIENLFGFTSLGSTEFLGLMGVRNRNVLDKNGLRALEGAFVWAKKSNKNVLVGKRNFFGVITSFVINESEILDITTGDIDLDSSINDEVLVAVKDAGKTLIKAYKFVGDKLVLTDCQLNFEGEVKELLYLKKTSYTLAPTVKGQSL